MEVQVTVGKLVCAIASEEISSAVEELTSKFRQGVEELIE